VTIPPDATADAAARQADLAAGQALLFKLADLGPGISGQQLGDARTRYMTCLRAACAAGLLDEAQARQHQRDTDDRVRALAAAAKRRDFTPPAKSC
jgi:hypothetical protein